MDAARANRRSCRRRLVVLTACTEIPLVLGRDGVDAIPLIDPMAVAAERAINVALGRDVLP